MKPNNTTMFIRNVPQETKNRLDITRIVLGFKNRAETIEFLIDFYEKNG